MKRVVTWVSRAALVLAVSALAHAQPATRKKFEPMRVGYWASGTAGAFWVGSVGLFCGGAGWTRAG